MNPRQVSITWIFSVLLVHFFVAGSGSVLAETISLNEYRFRVEESLALLKENDGRMQPEESSWFVGKFPQDLEVQDIEGERLPVDRSGFLHWIGEAENSSDGRDSLAAYQEALLKQISWGGGDLSLAKSCWGECRNLLDNVYGGKEFRYLSKRNDPAWKERIRRFIKALNKWLEDHLDFPEGIESKWILYLAYGVVFMLGAILIVWIIRLFGPVGWRRKQPSASPSPSIKSSYEKDWRELRLEANSKAREGAYREAIRFLFIYVLLEGHQKGWWIYEPESTNREHLARLEDQAERRKALQSLMERYELAWYGLRQPGREEFQDCEKWVHHMEGSA